MLISLDYIKDKDVEIGELITATAVGAANIVKDIKENIRNLVGGRMIHYEKLIESTIDIVLEKIQLKAKELGYDGILGLKLSHPFVTDGAAQIIAYGNGFKYINK